MSSPENRLPALPPSSSSLLTKLGWSLAIALGLLAALLASRYFALAGAVNLLSNDAELNRIEVQSLQQQLEAERIIAARQIADLTAKTTAEPLILVRLTASELGSASPGALIIWQPTSQSGIFFAERLPPTPEEDFRLWIETASGALISAGEIKVAPTGPTKVVFQATQLVGQPVRFLVTRERTGGAAAPSGPAILTGVP